MIEQIARAIADTRGQEFDALSGSYAGRVCLVQIMREAQAILPLIEAAVLAERERCAGVAEQPIFFDYVRLTTPDGPFEPGSPYDRGRQVEAERIAKAIRSQP